MRGKTARRLRRLATVNDNCTKVEDTDKGESGAKMLQFKEYDMVSNTRTWFETKLVRNPQTKEDEKIKQKFSEDNGKRLVNLNEYVRKYKELKRGI